VTILANVTFTGAGGTAVVNEVASKGVDAGFLLGDDVAGSGGKLTAIRLPNNDKPQVAAFGVAVVKSSKHPGRAQAFIIGLPTKPAQEDLLQAGFVPPIKRPESYGRPVKRSRGPHPCRPRSPIYGSAGDACPTRPSLLRSLSPGVCKLRGRRLARVDRCPSRRADAECPCQPAGELCSRHRESSVRLGLFIGSSPDRLPLAGVSANFDRTSQLRNQRSVGAGRGTRGGAPAGSCAGRWRPLLLAAGLKPAGGRWCAGQLARSSRVR
jgi:hypothetical protein